MAVIMAWKNMPYWLRGGTIFLIIHIILSLVGIIFIYDSTIPNSDLGLIILPNIFIPLILIDILPDIFGYWSNLYWGAIFWFIIGAIIGLIMGKLKSKNKKEVNK